jgi:2-methylcitrate dehydratase
MKRRDFLRQTAIAASASLLLESVQTDGYRLVGAAFAGSNGDDQKATLEQKFAEFAISIRYEALPPDWSPRPSAFFSTLSAAHLDQ